MKKYLLIFSLVLIVCALSYLVVDLKTTIKNNAVQTQQFLSKEAFKYTTRVSQLGDTIKDQKQNIVSLQQAEVLYKKELEQAKLFGFNKVEQIISMRSTIEDLTLRLTASDSIIVVYIKDTNKTRHTYLKLPQEYNFTDSIWYSTTFSLDSIGKAKQKINYFNSDPEIYIGDLKTKKTRLGRFFEHSKQTVSFINRNPYISTKPKYNIIIKQEKNFWKPVKYISIGVGSFYLGYKARMLTE